MVVDAVSLDPRADAAAIESGCARVTQAGGVDRDSLPDHFWTPETPGTCIADSLRKPFSPRHLIVIHDASWKRGPRGEASRSQYG
jgi:hypothetical protein